MIRNIRNLEPDDKNRPNRKNLKWLTIIMVVATVGLIIEFRQSKDEDVLIGKVYGAPSFGWPKKPKDSLVALMKNGIIVEVGKLLDYRDMVNDSENMKKAFYYVTDTPITSIRVRSEGTISGINSELSTIKYAINSLPGQGSAPIKVPVIVQLKAPGTYKIEMSQFDNPDDLDVMLRHGSVMKNMYLNSNYIFKSAAGTFTDFELILSKHVTGKEDADIDKQDFKTWYGNSLLNIRCPDYVPACNASMTVFDSHEKMVYQNTGFDITSGQTIQLPVNLAVGEYIAHILISGKPFLSRIVVF
jgi:hypothetical protein